MQVSSSMELAAAAAAAGVVGPKARGLAVQYAQPQLARLREFLHLDEHVNQVNRIAQDGLHDVGIIAARLKPNLLGGLNREDTATVNRLQKEMQAIGTQITGIKHDIALLKTKHIQELEEMQREHAKNVLDKPSSSGVFSWRRW